MELQLSPLHAFILSSEAISNFPLPSVNSKWIYKSAAYYKLYTVQYPQWFTLRTGSLPYILVNLQGKHSFFIELYKASTVIFTAKLKARIWTPFSVYLKKVFNYKQRIASIWKIREWIYVKSRLISSPTKTHKLFIYFHISIHGFGETPERNVLYDPGNSRRKLCVKTA